MLVADRSQARQIVVRWNADTTFALHRLYQHCHDIRVGRCQGFHRRRIAVFHPHETFHQRGKPGLHLGIAGRGQGCHGAPVERIGHDHHSWHSNALVVTVQAGNLEGSFISFRTRVAEKHFVQPGERTQFFRQGFLMGNLVQVGGVQQFMGLRTDGICHFTSRMAYVAHGNTAEGIQILFACGIPQECVFTFGESNRQTCIRRHYCMSHGLNLPKIRHNSQKCERQPRQAAFARKRKNIGNQIPLVNH